MMHFLHLLWIVPLTFFGGFALCALLTIAKASDEGRWWR